MSNIEKFLESAGGSWLKAVHVKVGDILKITTVPTIDAETFDKPYIICDVLLVRTNTPYRLRLGTKNVARIAETLGKDENEWVNKSLEVISIEDYAGLGQQGILLRGVSSSATVKPLSLETFEALERSKNIIEAKIALNEREFGLLPANVRGELVNTGLVKKTGNTYLFDADVCKQYLSKA